MHRPDPPSISFAATAASVAGAATLDAAYALVREDIFKQLLAPCCVLEWVGNRWALRTETVPEFPILEFIEARSSIGDGMSDFAVHRGVPATITVVPLTGVEEPRIVIAIEGDWSGLREALLGGATLLGLALQIVRERRIRHETARLLVDGYSNIRRLSRLGSVDDVARNVVRYVAQLLSAERVSLALYRDDNQSLEIVATEGFSLNSVKSVRIMPGDWVIGHVFASRRPVFVRDVRALPAFSANPTRYRTSSFAAVPMLAGSEAVGVITVTDKRGHEVFTRQDELVLRTLSAAAAVAVVAARAGDEVTRLAYAATIDSLTGLLNRPGFDNRLHQEVERTRRESRNLAVLMADVDDFKTINDTRGHQVGDAVLRHVGAVIRSSVRVFDVCARYGGDEFAVVMPNSDRESAILCAERIRKRLADRLADDELPALSMSIGVAVMASDDHAGDLVSRADQCLYRAKADGKNLVRAEPPQASVEASPAEPETVENESRIIDIRLAREEARPRAADSGPPELRYVLVVDSQSDRASFCLEAVSPFRVGFLLARDGAQATGIVDRFGPPLLLVVDLALPSNDGFALIERLRDRHGERSEVIAWSSSREMREYAGARLSKHDVHVLASTTALSTVRVAIQHCLERRVEAEPEPEPEPPPSWTAEQQQRVMSDLLYRCSQIVRTPGAAVYLRAPRERRYRASFSWNSDQLMPHSPSHLPRAFNEIAMNGRTILARDSGTGQGDAAAGDAIRGLAGVALRAGGELLGALCVFDVAPLEIADDQIAAMESLGRAVSDLGTSTGTEALQTIPASIEAIEERALARIVTDVLDWPPALLERVGGEFAVARELARARREGKELSVILFEFAPIASDTNVEESVQHASETLLRAIRQSDLPIRWSGREFLVVLPGLAGNAARSVAERVRAALQAGARHRVAVSGGVAELEDEEGFSEVVSRARERVSLARGRGHNRIL